MFKLLLFKNHFMFKFQKNCQTKYNIDVSILKCMPALIFVQFSAQLRNKLHGNQYKNLF